MKPLPSVLRATAFEYKHRFLMHGLIFTLGFAAPWHLPVWGFLKNQSTWFQAADALSRPTFENFAPAWNGLCAAALLLTTLGAGLRLWGASYLGATTVHQGGMEGSRIVANGPYRYLRNPLYLGTLLHAGGLGLLMRPEAAVITMLLLLVVQLRLIGREEPFLLQKHGEAYAVYCEEVPRLLPRLRPAGTPTLARPNWTQGLLSEVYPVCAALSFAVAGWTRGYTWEASVWHVFQGIVIGLGLSVIARAVFQTRRA